MRAVAACRRDPSPTPPLGREGLRTRNAGSPFLLREGGWGVRFFATVSLALLLAAFGCKHKDGGSASATKNNDPLVMGPGRIPKQNIPIPERGTAGKDRKDDPLLGSPAGRAGDKTGSSYNSDPERWKRGPFIPSQNSTPAALAGRGREDDEGLRIEKDGDRVRPAGGTVPAGDTEALVTELQKYGVTRGNYSFDREGGSAVFRARVPIGNDQVRQYTGQGATAADAVRQVLEHVKSDRN